MIKEWLLAPIFGKKARYRDKADETKCIVGRTDVQLRTNTPVKLQLSDCILLLLTVPNTHAQLANSVIYARNLVKILTVYRLSTVLTTKVIMYLPEVEVLSQPQI